MSDFRLIQGFEEVWRAPGGRRVGPETVLRPDREVRARIARIVARTPEVMVKVTGRTRDPGHLRAHLSYITRNGGLAAEGPDRLEVLGRGDVNELAEDWAVAAMMDSRRRANSPLSLGMVLSMPAATDAITLRDAARSFAERAFGERYDWVAVLHTDTSHPHVHLTVRALGRDGRRLNPKKADLQTWREQFAEALRERGIAAEATPRRTRGVTRRAPGLSLRKLLDRNASGRGKVPRVRRSAYGEAAVAAFAGDTAARPWERAIAQRQARIRALWLGQARRLQASASDEDRRLGWAAEAFVQSMPSPDTQRLALARELRAASERLRRAEVSRRQEPRRGESADRGRAR